MTARPYAEVIGDPIAHSKSPLIHNFWLGKLGIDADYRATRVTPDSLTEYLRERQGDPAWRGSNVTMPLKLLVLPHMAELSADTAQVGAANVVMPIPGGRLGGFNSDVDGVAEPLRALPEIDRASTPVQIVGAGGAAPAAAVGAMRAGFTRFDLYVRDLACGEALAARIGGRAHPLAALGPPDGGAAVLINATPMGMAGQEELPVDLAAYPAGTTVFEMVYNPIETGLLRNARARGLAAIDGLQMLVGQAAIAFEHFFGRPAPREHDAQLRETLLA